MEGHAGLTISHPEEGTICDQTSSRHLVGALIKSPRLGYNLWEPHFDEWEPCRLWGWNLPDSYED